MNRGLSWPTRAGVALIYAFMGAFLVYPLGYAFGRAFIVRGRFTTEMFQLLWENPSLRSSVGNSLAVAAWTTSFATIAGLFFAWLLCRTTLRGRGFWGTLMLAPMVMPPFVGAIGVRQIFGRLGMVNLFCIDHGLMNPRQPIDWLGNPFWGVVALETLHLFPIMYLNLVGAFSLLDPALEEAGRGLGSSGLRLLRTVTAPLLLPGLFAGAVVVFIWSFTELGTPLIFEFRETAPVQIFDMVKESGENPMGYALVVATLVLTAAIFIGARAMFGRRRWEMPAFGRMSPRLWRAPLWAEIPLQLFMGAVVLLALSPHISVILISFSKEWFMTILPSSWTTEYYALVFTHPVSMGAVRNSLGLSAASAILALGVGGAAAWLLARRRFAGSAVLDTLCMLPLAVPGVILAFGYVGGYSGTALDPRRNPVALLIAAYAIRRLPIVVRAVYAGLQQVGRALEEASASLGSGPGATLRKVSLPLISAPLVGAAVLSFAFAMLEVSDSLILAMEERFYPITKAIYMLLGRLSDGLYLASAMGVLGMLLLGVCLAIGQRLLGRKMGDMFRA